MVDQGSLMEAGLHSGMKRKAILKELTEDMITLCMQVIVIGDKEEVTSEELILNICIIDVMENEDKEGKTCYNKVMDFLKKVNF